MWEGNPRCPHCDGTNVYRTKSGKPMSHWCRECRRNFSIRAGTIMAGSKLSLRDFLVGAHIVVESGESIPTTKLREILDITQHSAWLLKERVIYGARKGDAVVRAVKEAGDSHDGGMNLPSIALDRYFCGVTYKDIARIVSPESGMAPISKKALHGWVKKHTNTARRFLAGYIDCEGSAKEHPAGRIRTNVGPTWMVFIDMVRLGGRRAPLWYVIDTETKYILAAQPFKRLEVKEATLLFRAAKEAAHASPETVLTTGDDVKARYGHAIQRVFGELNHASIGFFEPWREYENRAWSAPHYLVEGWAVHLNFFASEGAAWVTPAEAAGVADQVGWRSWLDVVKLSDLCDEKELDPAEGSHSPLLEHFVRRMKSNSGSAG